MVEISAGFWASGRATWRQLDDVRLAGICL
jgi:hypothetical protein